MQSIKALCDEMSFDHQNLFCCICGEVTFTSKKCLITPTIKKAYFLYFGCKVGDQGNKWASHA